MIGTSGVVPDCIQGWKLHNVLAATAVGRDDRASVPSRYITMPFYKHTSITKIITEDFQINFL